jgi:hypothetical protein
MAAAAHFTTRVYGMVQGTPPFANSSTGAAEFSRVIDFSYAGTVSFPTTGTAFFPLPNGVVVGGAYVYSVIQVAPSGLNLHPQQYVTDSSVATLATLAG